MLLYGEKLLENHLMEETYSKWPEWQKFYVKIKILTQGVVCLCPGALYMYKNMKNYVLFETCNKWAKWQGFSVDIRILSTKGCLPLPQGYIHVEKRLKKVYKIRIQKDLFETCNKWSKW